MNVYICSAKRTPIGSYGKTLKGVTAKTLGVTAAKAAIEQAGIDVNDIDETLTGCVLQGGQGQNIGRQIAVGAGLPITTPSITVNKVCASSMRCMSLGAQLIKSGDDQVVLVGGAESMSTAPYVLKEARWGARMNNVTMVDLMVNDGLWDVFNGYHMGITAENVAEQYGITREMQDELALASQQKAVAAIKAGKFRTKSFRLK